MAVNLSIKNVPDALAKQLRRRAQMSHRSLQGELLNILEEAVNGKPRLTPAEYLHRVRAKGLQTPREATAFVREDRDAH